MAWIDLSSCNIINLENNLVNNRPYSFDLFDTAIVQHHLLAADSEEEKERWIACFSASLRQQPLPDQQRSSSSDASAPSPHSQTNCSSQSAGPGSLVVCPQPSAANTGASDF